MSRFHQTGGIKFWSRLRTRMAISYITVTLVIVLILESMLSAAIYYVVTRSPLLSYLTLAVADHVAQVYALQTAVQADGRGLNSGTTFDPGQKGSLGLLKQEEPAQLSNLNLNVPYVAPGSPAPNYPAFALLIGLDEKVLASSYPDRYPASTNAAQELPGDIKLIHSALTGKTDGAMNHTSQGWSVSIARTIWDRDKKPIGAIYIQAPSFGPTNTNVVAQVLRSVLPSAILWLCFMLPIGAIFGVLTTRSVIRRIERLAGATARFKEGDTSQRVPINRPDEIGKLEQQFNQMAVELVDSFTERQTLAEQSARREERARIDQEMSSARYIQQALLPDKAPSIPGWQIEPFYRPAREVSGDLYDFLPLPDGRIGFVIGDVTGKGMPAALLMATTCTMIRAAAPGAASPGDVLALVNNLLRVHIPSQMFATCFYAILDPANGRLCFANAGHDIPYLSHAGEIVELRATGMPLGLMPDQSYSEHSVTIYTNDSILFYTDGLVEAHNPDREMFGFPQLKRLMQGHSHENALIEILLNELQDFTGAGWDQEDDVTLVLLRKMG